MCVCVCVCVCVHMCVYMCMRERESTHNVPAASAAAATTPILRLSIFRNMRIASIHPTMMFDWMMKFLLCSPAQIETYFDGGVD